MGARNCSASRWSGSFGTLAEEDRVALTEVEEAELGLVGLEWNAKRTAAIPIARNLTDLACRRRSGWDDWNSAHTG